MSLQTTDTPMPDNSDEPVDKNESHHPSYGMITASRYSTTPQTLFGSSSINYSGVALSISTAYARRELNGDYYYSDKVLIEVNLTENQFAQLITHMNQSPGTPCTITHVDAQEVSNIAKDDAFKRGPDEAARQTSRKRIENEFAKDMKDLGAQVALLMEQAKVLKSKPSINKSDRQVFLDTAEAVKAKIDSVAPFICARFNESVEGIITEAKADIQSFISQSVRNLGIETAKAKIQMSDEQAQSATKLLSAIYDKV